MSEPAFLGSAARCQCVPDGQEKSSKEGTKHSMGGGDRNLIRVVDAVKVVLVGMLLLCMVRLKIKKLSCCIKNIQCHSCVTMRETLPAIVL